MKSKKGFTLIELLAVIVILAIIALIATPIVLDIINDARKSSYERSAEMYLKAVEIAIMNEKVHNTEFNPSRCTVFSSGNLKCENYKEQLKVDTSGQTPTTGQITFENSKIEKVKLYYDNLKVLKDDKGVYVLDNEYQIGQELTFDAGQGEENWYVIDEDKENITLLSKNNMTNGKWIQRSTCKTYASEYYAKYINISSPSEAICAMNCGYVGPITLLTNINNEVSANLNIEPIKDYEYINNSDETNKASYRKITIKDGKTVITDVDGKQIEIPGITRARIITMEEYLEILSEINPNFLEENMLNYIYEYGKKEGLTKEQVDVMLEEEFLSQGMIERNWLTTTIVFLGIISDEDISNFLPPKFLTSNEISYYVLSTLDLMNGNKQASVFIMVESLENGYNQPSVISYNDNDYGYKYVITIKKSLIK